MKSILVAINRKYVHTALGLRYVNEFCRKNAIEVTLIEETPYKLRFWRYWQR